jgi:dGTPase
MFTSEESLLAPYAMRTSLSRGRRHTEEPHSFRSEYQRDRDRIIHCTGFRRLMYKTQVLVAQTNDYHRTRLTHTLEVAQISRTVARQLGLNEDLTEAIALAHDLGHPPFGHAGEDALDACLKDRGGFEHNHHGLRRVELLEYRYPDFPGLNLTYEVRESLALHSRRRDLPEIQEYLLGGQMLLEGQIVDACDSLAYDTHDVDDALNVGLIQLADLEEVEFWRLAAERARQRNSHLSGETFTPAVLRALINWQVEDLLEHTRQRLARHHIQSVPDVRRLSERLAAPGPEVQRFKAGLESFLMERVYHHQRVQRMGAKGQRIVRALFEEFSARPGLLPRRYADQAKSNEPAEVARDYVAGMTDRFAQDEFLRLFHPFTSV